MNYLSNQRALHFFSHLFDQSACYYIFHTFQAISVVFFHCLWLQVNNKIQD